MKEHHMEDVNKETLDGSIIKIDERLVTNK
jgi:hypothetical protein